MISPEEVQHVLDALDAVAADPDALHSAPAGGFPNLADWLREIQVDVRLLTLKPLAAERRRREIDSQLSAVVTQFPTVAARLRPLLARIAGWGL